LLPTRIFKHKNGTKNKVKKLSVPLGATSGSLVEDLQKWTLVEYSEVLRFDWQSELAKDSEEMCLQEDELSASEKGQAALISAAINVLRRGGAASGMVKSRGARCGEHVMMPVGHSMLTGSFVRDVLIVAGGLHFRQRHGKSEGAFEHSVIDVNPVKDCMRNDAAVTDGMSLVDGASSREFCGQITATFPPADTPDIAGIQAAALKRSGSRYSSGS